MTRILLIRHGQDEDNANGILNGRRDMPLTPFGREQARAVTRLLSQHGIDAILSSPLRRAYETAQIIAEVLGLDQPDNEPDLMERDFGILTGKPVADISRYTQELLVTERITYFLEVEGAENFPTLLSRAHRVLQRVKDRFSNQSIALVTHGDIGKMIKAAHTGLDWRAVLQTPYFDNTGILEL